jgi:hypothetical protein
MEIGQRIIVCESKNVRPELWHVRGVVVKPNFIQNATDGYVVVKLDGHGDSRYGLFINELLPIC